MEAWELAVAFLGSFVAGYVGSMLGLVLGTVLVLVGVAFAAQAIR